MEFGASFDDDFFEKAPEKKERMPLKYDAKICTPTWFMNPQCTEEQNPDRLNHFRHQADYYYFSKNYEDASRVYQQCLAVVPESNTTVRRECMENLARSLLQMNQEEKSLEWALRLHDMASTADQLLIAWNLLAVVCHRLGRFSEEMEALECCMEAHKFFPDLWLRFAHCHAGLVDIILPDSGVKRTHKFSRKTPCCAFHDRNHPEKNDAKCDLMALEMDDGSSVQSKCNVVYDLSADSSSSTGMDENVFDRNNSKCEVCIVGTQIVTACLLKSKLLLEGANPHHQSFASEKKAKLQNKIAACISALEMDADFLEQASQLMKSDMMEELKQNNETKDASTSDTTSQTQQKLDGDLASGDPKEGSSCSLDLEKQQETSQS